MTSPALRSGLLMRALAILGALLAISPFVDASSGARARDPQQPTTPLQPVVLIMKENRSFDEYFGQYPGANGATTGTMCDGTVATLAPTPDPLPRAIWHQPPGCFDSC